MVSDTWKIPENEHWNAIKRILRYIKGTSNAVLCYGGSEFTIKAYVDLDFAGDLDKRKSTTGYVFTLAKGVVSWASKLRAVVALSTIEALVRSNLGSCQIAIF